MARDLRGRSQVIVREGTPGGAMTSSVRRYLPFVPRALPSYLPCLVPETAAEQEDVGFGPRLDPFNGMVEL